MIVTSYLMGLICLLLVEFSFWPQFGRYYWHVFIAYTVFGMLLESIIDHQLKEVLVAAPVITALNVITNLTRLGASDFLNFLLGWCLQLSIIMLFRVYVDPILGDVVTSLKTSSGKFQRQFMNAVPKFIAVRLAIKQETTAEVTL